MSSGLFLKKLRGSPGDDVGNAAPTFRCARRQFVHQVRVQRLKKHPSNEFQAIWNELSGKTIGDDVAGAHFVSRCPKREFAHHIPFQRLKKNRIPSLADLRRNFWQTTEDDVRGAFLVSRCPGVEKPLGSTFRLDRLIFGKDMNFLLIAKIEFPECIFQCSNAVSQLYLNPCKISRVLDIPF